MKNLQVCLPEVSEISETQIILICIFLVLVILFMLCLLVYFNRKQMTKILREDIRNGKTGMTCNYRKNEDSDNIGEVLSYQDGLVELKTIGGNIDHCLLSEISIFYQVSVY